MKSEFSSIGLDVGGTKIYAARFSAAGKKEAETELPTEAHKGKEDILENICTAIDAVLNAEVRAIGIGWPGFVDSKNGVVQKTPNIPALENFPLAEKLQEKYGLPVRIENDAKLFTLAEAEVGAGKNQSYVLGIVLGTGVGSGLVIDGEMYCGHDGLAGEVGHAAVDLRNTEEVEAIFSGTALQKKFAAVGLPGKLSEQIKQYRHQKATVKILTEWQEQLASWIINLLLAFNPSVVVFGGSVSKHILAPFLPDITSQVQKLLRGKKLPLTVNLKISELENAGALGAALLAIKNSSREKE